MPPHGLHADGHAVLVIAHGEHDGRVASKVAGEDEAHHFGVSTQVRPAVAQRLRRDYRRGHGSGRAEDHIHFLERLCKKPHSPCAHALRLDVIVRGHALPQHQAQARGRCEIVPVFREITHAGSHLAQDGDSM